MYKVNIESEQITNRQIEIMQVLENELLDFTIMTTIPNLVITLHWMDINGGAEFKQDFNTLNEGLKELNTLRLHWSKELTSRVTINSNSKVLYTIA